LSHWGEVSSPFVSPGIPREDIVLGFHPAELRRHTDFAVG
jgi:hypothetical protein